ncbi:MAG: winged helix-turn-helix transcriptional regulator [Chloroflexales bacterium]|nr:winged helix-turn-helix transcriptional regulator [Chloroflexales bacterium]
MIAPGPDLQAFLKAIASETRQAILVLFATNEALTVNQIAEAVGIGQSTASEHLAVLRRAGLLTATRAGKEVYYRPDYPRMVGSAEQLLDYLKSCARC